MPTFKHPCPRCGAYIERDVVACPHCGARDPFAPGRCPSCRTVVEAAWVACPKCGSALVAEAARSTGGQSKRPSTAASGRPLTAADTPVPPPPAPAATAAPEGEASRCSACGSVLPTGAAFCRDCGALVS